MEREQFQKELMKRALEQGFEHCEVYFESAENFEVLVLEGEISHYENSSQTGICFRGIYSGSMGYAYATTMEEETIDYIIQQSKENAEVIEETEKEVIFEGSDEYTQIDSYNENLKMLSPEQKMEAAKEMEKGALQEYEQVSIDYCVLQTIDKTIALSNSKGLSLCHRKNGIAANISTIAQQNGDVKTASEDWISNDWSAFYPQEIGRKAGQKAVSHLGAYSLESGEYRVLLENHVAAELLSVFAGIFYGENVQKGFSLLNGKLKEKIASSKVTLRDDGLLKNAPGSVPFDHEGVAVKNKVIIENGRLETFLYNLKSATKHNTVSTGNGFKDGYKSTVKTKCTNLYIQQGGKTPRTLMAQLGEGILITDIAGLHSGANAISGDFSLSAEGFWLERGQIVRPVEQITIGGNFYTMLKLIEEVGNDLKFIIQGSNGVMGAPMIMIKRLSVAGI